MHIMLVQYSGDLSCPVCYSQGMTLFGIVWSNQGLNNNKQHFSEVSDSYSSTFPSTSIKRTFSIPNSFRPGLIIDLSPTTTHTIWSG